MKRKTPESAVLKACLDLLAWHKVWHVRLNTVGTRVMQYRSKAGDIRRGVIRGLPPGTADILAGPCVRWKCACCADKPHKIGIFSFLWIECKRADGKQTAEQKEFEIEALKHGHYYLVVRDVNELSAWLKDHGAI